MKWKKLGVLIHPDKNAYWMTSHVGPSFAEVIDDKKLAIYVTGRDMNNVSRIGIVYVSLEGEKHSVLEISQEVLFDVGEIGTFDESGVSYPWLVRKGSDVFMYYAGWVAGGLSRFQNYAGVAVSKDGGKTYTRPKNVPILDRTDSEPFGSGSCCVFIENGIWKMYYTAFGPWQNIPGKNRPSYNIKYAHSVDGINWVREGKVIVDFKNEDEYVIGKPVLVKDKDLYRLWVSCRGESYRIGYAESKDGMTYIRKDEEVGIDVSPSGWDDKMIEYGYVFDYKERRYMIYNGNDFGKTGLGIAILEA